MPRGWIRCVNADVKPTPCLGCEREGKLPMESINELRRLQKNAAFHEAYGRSPAPTRAREAKDTHLPLDAIVARGGYDYVRVAIRIPNNENYTARIDAQPELMTTLQRLAMATQTRMHVVAVLTEGPRQAGSLDHFHAADIHFTERFASDEAFGKKRVFSDEDPLAPPKSRHLTVVLNDRHEVERLHYDTVGAAEAWFARKPLREEARRPLFPAPLVVSTLEKTRRQMRHACDRYSCIDIWVPWADARVASLDEFSHFLDAVKRFIPGDLFFRTKNRRPDVRLHLYDADSLKSTTSEAFEKQAVDAMRYIKMQTHGQVIVEVTSRREPHVPQFGTDRLVLSMTPGKLDITRMSNVLLDDAGRFTSTLRDVLLRVMTVEEIVRSINGDSAFAKALGVGVDMIASPGQVAGMKVISLREAKTGVDEGVIVVKPESPMWDARFRVHTPEPAVGRVLVQTDCNQRETRVFAEAVRYVSIDWGDGLVDPTIHKITDEFEFRQMMKREALGLLEMDLEKYEPNMLAAYVKGFTEARALVMEKQKKKNEPPTVYVFCPPCAGPKDHHVSRLAGAPTFICGSCGHMRDEEQVRGKRHCKVRRCGIPLEKQYSGRKGVMMGCPVHGNTAEE